MLGFGTLLWKKKKTLGQTMAEYALIVALVAIATIAVLTLFGNQLRSIYAGMTRQLAGDESAQNQDVSGGATGEVDKSLDQW
jgi:Flp pilus assembly pilin Flp